MYNVNEVIDKINNAGKKVKINYRLRDNKHILFLNYRKMVDGKIKQMTKRVATLTGIDKKQDLITLQVVDKYRDSFEKSMHLDKNTFKLEAERLFLTDYIDIVARKYTVKSTKKNMKSMKNYVIKFAGVGTTLAEIDKPFCVRFADFMNCQKLVAASVYFDKFKMVLYRAVDEGIIADLPFLRKLSIKKIQAKREYLTEKELSMIYQVETPFVDYKNAFVFGCYTGLRFVDLFSLRWENIQGNKLSFRQHKTNELLELKLHSVALDILKIQRERQSKTDKVFNLLSYETWRVKIKDIVKQANITKTITGHCARHTFATLCITQGVDIYTVSKLLGHTDIKHTQIYAKLIDKKKDDAISKLPSI